MQHQLQIDAIARAVGHLTKLLIDEIENGNLRRGTGGTGAFATQLQQRSTKPKAGIDNDDARVEAYILRQVADILRETRT